MEQGAGRDPAQRVKGDDEVVVGLNELRLRGRVSQDAEERELPSGTRIVGFRVVVPRATTAMTKGSRQRSDWIECTAWSAAVRRKVLGWRAGDTVEVTGSVRRRYSRAGAGLSSVELEVLEAVRVERAKDPVKERPSKERPVKERPGKERRTKEGLVKHSAGAA